MLYNLDGATIMKYKALIETYTEKICPFCCKKSCKRDIRIKHKNITIMKCSEYKPIKKASK